MSNTNTNFEIFSRNKNSQNEMELSKKNKNKTKLFWIGKIIIIIIKIYTQIKLSSTLRWMRLVGLIENFGGVILEACHLFERDI